MATIASKEARRLSSSPTSSLLSALDASGPLSSTPSDPPQTEMMIHRPASASPLLPPPAGEPRSCGRWWLLMLLRLPQAAASGAWCCWASPAPRGTFPPSATLSRRAEPRRNSTATTAITKPAMRPMKKESFYLEEAARGSETRFQAYLALSGAFGAAFQRTSRR